MYNIKNIKDRYDREMKAIEEMVKHDFVSHFESFYVNKSVPGICNKKGDLTCKYELNSYDETEQIFSGAGMYIIFSNMKNNENACNLRTIDQLRPIYRGHCSTTKRRIQSHLFNKQYNSFYEQRKNRALGLGKTFSEVPFNACMKLNNNENGINIEEAKYRKFKWLVIVHKMTGSNRMIREQAEKAFDDVFNKPLACRDRH